MLLEDLLDTYLVTYLTALANGPKLNMPAATERIRQDINDAYQFFGTYKKMKELEPQMEVLDQVLSMLEASKSLVFLSYWSFAKVHGPCIQFVEALMKARNDLDRSAVSEVMDSVKRKVKDEGLTDRTLSWSPCLHDRPCSSPHSTRTDHHEEDRDPRSAVTVPRAHVETSLHLHAIAIYYTACAHARLPTTTAFLCLLLCNVHRIVFLHTSYFCLTPISTTLSSSPVLFGLSRTAYHRWRWFIWLAALPFSTTEPFSLTSSYLTEPLSQQDRGSLRRSRSAFRNRVVSTMMHNHELLTADQASN